jgi:hypothetical protein
LVLWWFFPLFGKNSSSCTQIFSWLRSYGRWLKERYFVDIVVWCFFLSGSIGSKGSCDIAWHWCLGACLLPSGMLAATTNMQWWYHLDSIPCGWPHHSFRV